MNRPTTRQEQFLKSENRIRNLLQRTWNRPDAMAYANIFGEHIIPNYQLLMESHTAPQEAVAHA